MMGLLIRRCDTGLGVTTYVTSNLWQREVEKIADERGSLRDSDELWGSGCAATYFRWFPNDLGHHHRFTSLPLQYSSCARPGI